MVKSDARPHLDEKQGRKKPEWLDELLSQRFFTPCDLHSSSKKNERNIYCVDCSVPICQHCSRHSLHSLLQIRRYVYHDVVRLQDITKLVDCAHVQPYIINSAKVVFLNRRQSAAKSSSVNVCRWCQRALQDAYKYCSVACKVDAVLQKGIDEDVDSMIRKTSTSTMAEAPIVYDTVYDNEMDSFTLSSCRNVKSAVIFDPSNRMTNRRPSAAATPSPAESQQTTITAKSAVISASFNLSIAKVDGDSFAEEEEEEEQLSSPNSVLIDSNGCDRKPASEDHQICRRIPNYNNSSDHDLVSTTSSTSISSNGDYQQMQSVICSRRKSTPRRSPIF